VKSRPQLWNRYAYTGGNPAKFVDPEGRLRVRAFDTRVEVQGSSFQYEIDFETLPRIVNDRAAGLLGPLGKAIKKMGSGLDTAEDIFAGEAKTTSDRFSDKLRFAGFEHDLAKKFKEESGLNPMTHGTYNRSDYLALQSALTKLLNEIRMEDPDFADEIEQRYDLDRLRERAEESARQSLKDRLKGKIPDPFAGTGFCSAEHESCP
jgi:hypothetical protein